MERGSGDLKKEMIKIKKYEGFRNERELLWCESETIDEKGEVLKGVRGDIEND